MYQLLRLGGKDCLCEKIAYKSPLRDPFQHVGSLSWFAGDCDCDVSYMCPLPEAKISRNVHFTVTAILSDLIYMNSYSYMRFYLCMVIVGGSLWLCGQWEVVVDMCRENKMMVQYMWFKVVGPASSQVLRSLQQTQLSEPKNRTRQNSKMWSRRVNLHLPSPLHFASAPELSHHAVALLEKLQLQFRFAVTFYSIWEKLVTPGASSRREFMKSSSSAIWA